MSTCRAGKYWRELRNGRNYSKTVKEKDLWVTMNANMKVSEQCRIAASKGNQVLGMIRRNTRSLSTLVQINNIIRPLRPLRLFNPVTVLVYRAVLELCCIAVRNAAPYMVVVWSNVVYIPVRCLTY